MAKTTQHYLFFFLKLYVVLLLFSPLFQTAFCLSEITDLYQSPQGQGMGNALTADATGYQAIYYNPAALAHQPKRKVEVNLIDIEGSLGTSTIGLAWQAQSFGPYRFFGNMQQNPGTYYYESAFSIPSVTFRGFGISLLNSYSFAGKSDGTQLDTLIRRDAGIVFAMGTGFAGGLLKLGVTGKFLVRNELQGLFAHNLLSTYNDSSLPSLFKEGWGVGADLGMIVTLPEKYLPTFALVWKDLFGTSFHASHILNSQASGIPNSIPQSVNAAFSIHPTFSREVKTTFSLEYKHLELGELQFRKHLHLGFQVEHTKQLFIWAGLYQLYPTFGLGYRVKGGNFELSTYAVDVGDGNLNQGDRRFSFRYTVSF